MATRPTFSQYLMGKASQRRPAFLHAYACMWIHLCCGAVLLLVFAQVPMLKALAALTIASFSMAIVVYGVLVRQYTLLVTLVPYGLSMTTALFPEDLNIVLPVLAAIFPLVSGYSVMSGEYCRYVEEVGRAGEAEMPVWIGILVAVAIISLCLLGLSRL